MSDVIKTIKNIFRIVFIGVVAITAIVKAFDVKPKERPAVSDEDREYITSEFDEIW